MYTDRSTYTFTIVNKHNRINTNLSHHIVPSIRRQESDRCCTYYILFDCGFSNDSNTDTRCGSVGRFERIFVDFEIQRGSDKTETSVWYPCTDYQPDSMEIGSQVCLSIIIANQITIIYSCNIRV